MPNSYHSVKLARDKCKGCTTCIATCPTEAIRVRKGKAVILEERCIDCGVCIRNCPSHAKEPEADTLEDLNRFDYRVALPAPSLYGQFNARIGIDKILSGLINLGFDDIFEVAEAAEIVAAETRKVLLDKKGDLPLISSSCPAIVRLVQFRFPGLLDQIIRVESPMETAARIVREEIHPGRKNLGIFFISPCPAKVTAVRNPLGTTPSQVDGIIPINEIYLPLLTSISEIETPAFRHKSSFRGISWAVSEGEAAGVGCSHIVAVDNIHHVSRLFEEIENRRFRNIDFIEAMACPGGCVGGPLMVENPYIAKSRVRNKAQEIAGETPDAGSVRKTGVDLHWKGELSPKQILKLDENFQKAIEMMDSMETLIKELPGLDCGSCGAPNCRALAEDIVRGTARKNDCIFVLREEIRVLSGNLAELGAWMPPSMDKEDE